jgi:hypothetical protein
VGEDEKGDSRTKETGKKSSRGFSPRERRNFLKRHILVAERLGRGRDADVRVYSRKSGGRDRKVRGIKVVQMPAVLFQSENEFNFSDPGVIISKIVEGINV